MKRHIEIGSQLYINKYDSPEHIRNLTRKMFNSGLTIIRLFMVWDTLESEKGKWDFSLFDECFDEAQKHNMSVVPTLMPVSPSGYEKITMGSQDIWDIDEKINREKGLNYVKKIVERYVNHPALHSWILWNEPSRNVTINQSNIDDFTSFLQREYQTIENYNKKHYRSFNSFSDLKNNYCTNCEVLAFKPYTEETDELSYSVYNLCNMLRDIGTAVREIDKVHPIHINPHDIARESYYNGQNFFEEGKVVDFLGCSAHPSWHSVDFKNERIPLSIGYFADVMRSASKDKNRFWVTELQGGTNIFSGRDYLCPSEKDILLWLAESIASGAEKAVFWCFNSRNSGFEGGEWGLLNQLEEESERLAGVKKFSNIIKENQHIFDLSKPKTPDVYILYSDNTIRLQMIECNFESKDGVRNKRNGFYSLVGAYTAIRDLGFTPAFISEEQIRSGEFPKSTTLILPDTYSLDEKTVDTISDFVEKGGVVIADGLIAMKKSDGRISQKCLMKCEKLFGGKVEDIIAQNPFCISNGNITSKGEFFKVKLQKTQGKFEGDILINCLEKGKAIRLPGIMFRHYRRYENEEFLMLLKEYLPKESRNLLLNHSKSLYLRELEYENGKILFVFNCSNEKKTAMLDFNDRYVVLTGQKPIVLDNTVNIELEEKETAIIVTYFTQKDAK